LPPSDRIRESLAASDVAGRDAWLRFAPAWHAVTGGLAATTAVLLFIDDSLSTVARYCALGLTAAILIWYALVGRLGLLREGSRAGLAYILVAAPLTVGLFAVAPVGSLMLFALYPHIWAMLVVRWAVVATVVVVVGVGVIAGLQVPALGSVVATVLVMGAVSLVVALPLGFWIARIISQSRQRAELVAELNATRAELAAVSHQAGVLAERERLAREIHDTLAQGFTSVLLLLDAADAAFDTDATAARRHVDGARVTARENLAEARALVAALTPPDLTETSLPEALRRIVERADSTLGPAVDLTVTGAPYGLPAEHEVALLRSAQEAITNARRHSGARAATVTLDYAPGEVTLQVRDDGRGFDPETPSDNGYGLAGMRARVGGIGGTMALLAAPGHGVAITVTVPVG
jgi:signal transduction histidine kinase